MELILVRHGLPERVELEGGRADPPLSPLGRRQSERVADWLCAERIDAVYSSTMRRAIETAEPFAQRTGLEVRREDDVWTAHVLGLTPSLFFEPRYTSIHRYLCARTGERNVVSLNETGHLRGLADA